MLTQAKGWGPDGKRAAISITFDNMGEASELERGLPPVMGPSGKHSSLEILPDLLRILDGSKITYFVEGLNCEMYPDVIRTVQAAGHEIGVHGWRHENWGTTDAARREDALKRSVAAFRSLGVDVRGFRPPGGKVDAAELRKECLAVGLNFASPLGDIGDDTKDAGFTSLPFAWQHVDAYMLHPGLGALRQMFGDPEEPISYDEWGGVVDELIRKVKREGGHATLIFHPSMLVQSERAVEIFAQFVKTVREDADIWAPTCSELVGWLSENGHS